jgi:hypothetical protein
MDKARVLVVEDEGIVARAEGGVDSYSVISVPSIERSGGREKDALHDFP